ncbi:peroxin [Lecanora helva]
MIEGARRWLRRNRTSLTVGIGVIGLGYVATQYVISKITEARERIAGERIAKENLQRRFQQNQEDCTITVLELLPSVADNILEALPAEKIAEDIQQKKVQRTGRSGAISDPAPSDLSSGAPSAIDEDGKSLSSFQSESYVHASQMGTSSSGSGEAKILKSKAQLWSELKISSITRCFTLLYTISTLSLLTRIQLNLLGRRNYLSSVVSLASHSPQDQTISLENRDDDNQGQPYGNDFETNRKYLTFSWWLLHRGWKELLQKVEPAVREVFGPRKPNEEISLETMSGLILDVRRKVEGANPEERRSQKWLPFLLPPQDQETSVLHEAGMSTPPPPPQSPGPQDPTSIPSPPTSPSPPPAVSPPLRRLLDETADLIESPLFTHVLTLLLDATFSQLADTRLRSEAYKIPPLNAEPTPSAPEDRITEVTEVDPATASTKLATILAVMTREAHRIGAGVPNEYVQATESVSELEGFAAVVYSSNFEVEAGLQGSSGGISDSVTQSGNGEESTGERTHGLEGMSAEEAEEAIAKEQDSGIVGRATGVVDAAWGGLGSVWSRVTGAS